MMSLIFQTVLSISLSGALLILALFLGGRLWKGKLGRQWQYYIWLVVLFRLLLPFGPEVSLTGRAYQAVAMRVQTTRDMREVNPTERSAQGSSVQNAEQSQVESSVQAVEYSKEESLERNAEYSKEERQGQNAEQSQAESFGRNAGLSPEQNMNQESPESVTDKGAVLEAKDGAADLVWKYLGVIWLAAACGMLLRKVTAYQRYLRYVTMGAEPVNDVLLLNLLAATAQEMGVGRAVELSLNPQISTPMLVGYFHPCVVLPRADMTKQEFQYIVMHELTHYRRRDIWYKWLVQLAVCIHWFSPFVYLMRREIDRACEFACDEAVIRKAGYDHAKDYGETLLNAMAAAGTYREPFAAVTMSANKELLKERLGAVMNVKKKTKTAAVVTAGLTVAIAAGAFFLGAYQAAAAESEQVRNAMPQEKTGISVAEGDKAAAQMEKTAVSGADKNKATAQPDKAGESEKISDKETAISAAAKARRAVDKEEIQVRGEAEDNIRKNAEETVSTPEVRTDENEKAVAKAEDLDKYYKGRSLPMFHIAFYELDEAEQEAWLNRIYADGEIDFFSVCVWALDADSPLRQLFAEKFYADGDIAFFSVLADEMNDETLEKWLDRALKDQKWSFQSMLYDKLGRDEELSALEKAMEEEQLAQYRAVGVTQSGKNYYYEGQLVNVFLDVHRPNRSFYTLSMNPAGTVNIKIVRAEDGKITGVAYMTEAEVEELFGELYGDSQEQGE